MDGRSAHQRSTAHVSDYHSRIICAVIVFTVLVFIRSFGGSSSSRGFARRLRIACVRHISLLGLIVLVCAPRLTHQPSHCQWELSYKVLIIIVLISVFAGLFLADRRLSVRSLRLALARLRGGLRGSATLFGTRQLLRRSGSIGGGSHAGGSGGINGLSHSHSGIDSSSLTSAGSEGL